ncbi:MAG: S-layer homology domain-containing protein [Hungatella sp.]|nr:S-layer homology domain-containing protein [Hungatella sp.]
MNQVRMAACGMAAAVFVVGMPFAAEAAGNYELRKKVIGLSGIMSVTAEDGMVTRGEFAQMLVNASPYRSVALQVSATAVFSDVPAGVSYASAVRLAAENGWMSGYLGGVFRPEQQITLQEAVRGLLALLGYTDEDFTGNQINGRWAKYHYLELGENVAKEPGEVLTRADCVNLFYNLLCTETSAGKAYATVLGYELSDDGEVNPLTIADNELKGPKVVKKSYSLDDELPFKVSEATFYLDGQMSTLERVKQAKANGFVVIYYNVNTKTVWAYSMDNESGLEGNNMVAVKGEISGIFYSSANVMTPSIVTLEEYGDAEFRLKDSDVQFAFSIYGEMQVGDQVILICEKTGGSDGVESYTVTDYIEY